MARAIEVVGIDEKFLATPSISLQICYYSPPPLIFSSVLIHDPLSMNRQVGTVLSKASLKICPRLNWVVETGGGP